MKMRSDLDIKTPCALKPLTWQYFKHQCDTILSSLLFWVQVKYKDFQLCVLKDTE